MNTSERIRELEDAERACKAANESQRTTIRELEAELAGVSPIALHPHASRWFLEKCHDLSYKERDLLKARAEKAEQALKVYQDAEPIWRARVAELETLLQRAVGFGLGGSWEHEAATLLEAREREAD